MTFIHFNSITDREKQLCLTQGNAIVSLLKKKDTESDRISLVIEEIKEGNKIFITHYSIFKNPENSDEYKIRSDKFPQPCDYKTVKKGYLHLLNNENYYSKSWSIPNFKAQHLHGYLNDLTTHGFNELGSQSLGPQTGAVFKAAYPWSKGTILTIVGEKALVAMNTLSLEGILAVHPAVLGAFVGTVATEVTTKVDPNCESGGFFLEKWFGRSKAKFVVNSMHPPGDNSYTWAKRALLFLDEEEITKFLPFKSSDLYFAQSSQIKPTIQ